MTVLFEGHAYLEGPRVRDGQLYCANTFASAVLRFDAEGKQSLVCQLLGIPCGLGFLPDGDLIVLEMTARKLWRFRGDKLTLYADLSTVAVGTIDDMIVDAEGNAYVGDLGFDLFSTPKPATATGRLLRVSSAGATHVVAENLDFPNGIAVTRAGDRLAVAETSGDSVAWFDVARGGDLSLRGRVFGLAEPDGICLARDGKLWVAQFGGDSFVCVDDAGQRHGEITVPGLRAIACWLSEDEQTLFGISAETTPEDLLRGRSRARLEATHLPALPADS